MPGPTPTAMEDYVKVIYAHTEWQSQPITTNALAARLAADVGEQAVHAQVRARRTEAVAGRIDAAPVDVREPGDERVNQHVHGEADQGGGRDLGG